MQTEFDGVTFKYRRKCAITGNQIYRQSDYDELNEYDIKRMNRVIKYCARINYNHFSQFDVPLERMTAIEYKDLKQRDSQIQLMMNSQRLTGIEK